VSLPLLRHGQFDRPGRRFLLSLSLCERDGASCFSFFQIPERKSSFFLFLATCLFPPNSGGVLGAFRQGVVEPRPLFFSLPFFCGDPPDGEGPPAFFFPFFLSLLRGRDISTPLPHSAAAKGRLHLIPFFRTLFSFPFLSITNAGMTNSRRASPFPVSAFVFDRKVFNYLLLVSPQALSLPFCFPS